MGTRYTWRCCAWALAAAFCTQFALAQQPPAGGLTLKQAFEAAWARQPEANSAHARRDAAAAQRRIADEYTPEPPSFELGLRSDRIGSNRGTREYEGGVAVPMWLPGERARAQALADAQIDALDPRVRAARLRLAGAVREAYWRWSRAEIDLAIAQARVLGAERLAADVKRRVQAGDLSRADAHQAEGAVATAEVAVAELNVARDEAAQVLQALTGAVTAIAPAAPVAEPAPAEIGRPPSHASLDDLAARAAVARQARELARSQTRAHPELTLMTTRERDAYGDPYGQSVTLGVRIPFGSDSRRSARIASASAELLEAEAQARVEADRVRSAIDLARARVSSVRAHVAAAKRRAALAAETRGFFDRAFRLGESDLPTRLRVELEAAEAERQAARAAVELASAISLLRQALGLLPE